MPHVCFFVPSHPCTSHPLYIAKVSFGADVSLPPGRGPPVFRVHGAVYHASVSLDPDAEAGGKYAQLYLYESGDALQQRALQHPRLSEQVLNDLQGMLEEESPFVATYRSALFIIAQVA